jgi:ankyrin repeat protein
MQRAWKKASSEFIEMLINKGASTRVNIKIYYDALLTKEYKELLRNRIAIPTKEEFESQLHQWNFDANPTQRQKVTDLFNKLYGQIEEQAINIIQYGTPSELQSLIARGFKFSHYIKVDHPLRQVTPLNFALHSSSIHKHAIVKILLENGADANETDIGTLLVHAIKTNSKEIVKLLLKHNATVTPLALVDALDKPDILKALLKKDSRLINNPCYKDSTDTLLMVTLKQDYSADKKLRTITVLLKYGAKVTEQALKTAFNLDSDNHAESSKQPGLLMALLNADPTLINTPIIQINGELQTLLDAAYVKLNTPIMRALLKTNKISDEQKEKHLIQQVSSIRSLSPVADRIPFLISACKSNSKILTKALITHLKFNSVNAQTINELITAGADINEKDKDGNSILMLAIKTFMPAEERLQIIDLIINAGAAIDATNNRGNTALIEALVNLPRETKIIEKISPKLVWILDLKPGDIDSKFNFYFSSCPFCFEIDKR